MWRICVRAWIPLTPASGTSVGAADPASLIYQYKQAQATAGALTDYVKHQADPGGLAKPVQQEALGDLLSLTSSKEIASQDVAKVQALVIKTYNCDPLTQQDIDDLRGIVASLGAKLVAASPDTAGMSPDLKAAIAQTPNADRAIATFTELKALQAQPGGARLTDDLIGVVTLSVARPLDPGSGGEIGIMGKESALKAGQALISMTPEEYSATQLMLLKAGDLKCTPTAISGKGGDSQLEQGLILKAIGNGYSPLTAYGTPARNAEFFKQVGEFAMAIHGVPRNDLIRDTGLIGIGNQGQGLNQRFTATCFMTDLQMMKGQQDPMYAWKLAHDGPVHGLSATGMAAAEQREGIINDHFFWGSWNAAVPTPAQVFLDYPGFDQAIGKRKQDIEDTLPDLEEFRSARSAVTAHISTLMVNGPTDPALRQALAKLRDYLRDPSIPPPTDPATLAQLETARMEMAKANLPVDLEKLTKVHALYQDCKTYEANLDLLHQYMDGQVATPTPEQLAGMKLAIGDLQAQGVAIDQARVDDIHSQAVTYGLDSVTSITSGPDATVSLYDRTGNAYSLTKIDPATSTTGGMDASLDKAASLLEAGTPVIFGMNFPSLGAIGHGMMFGDVRGNSPERHFLVADPSSGTTAWVMEDDLKSGSFASDPKYGFNMPPANITSMAFPGGMWAGPHGLF